MALSRAQATTILRNLGWRVNNTTQYTTSLKNFQAGWNLGTKLAEDGKCGSLTSAALLKSEARRKAGSGTASAHFSFIETRCKCGGKYASCQRIWTKRRTFQMMEGYRAKSGKALTVVSGCRCVSHNKAVGGSPTSRHPAGLACDVPPRYSTRTVRGWKVATHIGYSPSLSKVVHIDLGAGGSLSSPVVYKDGH